MNTIGTSGAHGLTGGFTMRTLFLLAALATTFLSGCASVVSRGNFAARAPSVGEAMVYMIRPYDFESTMLPVSISVDDKAIASLTLNDGIYLRLTAGRHSIRVSPPIGQSAWSFPVGDHEILVEEGKQYVLALAVSVVGSTPSRTTLSAVYLGPKAGVVPVFGVDGGLQKGARWQLSEFDASNSVPELLKIGFRESR